VRRFSAVSPEKNETKKSLETASRSVATDYFHSTPSFTKNDKTPYGHKVYGVDATHINSVSNPMKAKQLAFISRVSS